MDYDIGVRLDMINAKLDALIKALSAPEKKEERPRVSPGAVPPVPKKMGRWKDPEEDEE